MEHFWDEVSKSVQGKTELNAEQYMHSLEEQKETIVKFLTFSCYPDPEDADIVEIKKEILELYTNNIAHLISKFEVYEHDLDASCVQALFYLMQIIATAELTKNKDEKKQCYEYALKHTYFIKHMAHVLLIDCYKERIKYYKKSLRFFNRKGIKINGEKFDKVIKKQYSEAINLYKTGRDKYFSYLNYDIVTRSTDFLYKKVEKAIGFEETLGKLENIIDTYEENYPKIINEGYSWPVTHLIDILIKAVSLGFLIYGIINLLK
ncbi:MAG: hypothetical protein IJN40_02975 [Clostridia bacterium]|nr:hypothetical protein [Clostridia bacterium]